MSNSRQTKYCRAVHEALRRLDIATNADILLHVRKEFPAVSATTVHRVTARLCAAGDIGCAPPAKNGAVRYDTYPGENAYFSCSDCYRVKRLDGGRLADMLKSQLEGCSVSGQLIVSGICKICKEKK